MILRRWEPLGEFVPVRRAMDRMFDGFFGRPWRLGQELRGEGGLLPLDVYQTPENLVVKATLPGVKPEDVGITITGDSLSIKAEKKAEEETKEEDYFIRERRYGSRSRTISLPSGLNTDKAEASFEHGVLTLSIPKVEEAKPKEVKVKISKS